MAKRQKTTDDIDAALKRWKTRMKRAMTAIDKLERQRKRSTARPPVTMIAIAKGATGATGLVCPGAVGVAAPAPGFMELAGAGIVRAEPKPEPTPEPTPPAFDGDKLRQHMLAKAKALREGMQRKKPVRTKRAPLSTPPASA